MKHRPTRFLGGLLVACAAVSGLFAPRARAGTSVSTPAPAPVPARVVVAPPETFPAGSASAATCRAGGKPVVRTLSIGVDRSPGITDIEFRGPSHEIEMFASTLRARGAEVGLLLNPSHGSFVANVRHLIERTGCGDKVILHFSVIGMVHPGGPWVIFLPEFGEAPMTVDGAAARELRGVISAPELRSAVTALRNRGADVVVLLDTGHAEASDLLALDRARAIWSSSAPQGATATDLLPGHGQLAAFYSADRSHMPLEANVELPGGRSAVATAFAVAAAAALSSPDVRTARDLAGSLLRSIEDHYRSRGLRPGDAGYVWPVVEMTDPDLTLFEAAPGGAMGAVSIVIDTPATTRGAVPLTGTNLRVAGHLQPASPAARVFVNGDEAPMQGDGRFSVATEVQLAQRSVRVIAVLPPDLRVIMTDLPLSRPDGAAGAANVRRRFALLIAEQAYPPESGFAPLSTPIGDAEALARVLTERYGFTTEVPLDGRSAAGLRLVNATRRQIVDTLNLLRQRLAADDALLIFYAGHGWRAQNGDIAYWIPVDAETDNWGTYISAVDITSQLKAMAARHVLLVSDSCYAGALSRGELNAPFPPAAEADRPRFLEQLLARRSRVLLSSGADEPVDDGGGDGHSVFARALLDGLTRERRPAITAEELLVGYLKPLVVGNSRQSPQHAPLRGSGHEGGDFVFVRTSTPSGPAR